LQNALPQFSKREKFSHLALTIPTDQNKILKLNDTLISNTAGIFFACTSLTWSQLTSDILD
jgi:hypothetical protein